MKKELAGAPTFKEREIISPKQFVDALVDLLLRFVRMSEKKTQKKTIEEIRNVLRTIGPRGLKKEKEKNPY